MPTRLLRDWTDSFAVDELDVNAERFFVRLIMVVDDYGRFHADPRMLRSKCFPLKTDIRDADIARWLAACKKSGMLRCYKDHSGRALLEVCNFKQRSRTESKFPSPDNCPSNDGQMTALGGDVGGDEDECEGVRIPARENFLNQVWEASPPKSKARSSRKQLADAWDAIRQKPDMDDVIAALEAWNASEEWTKEGGQFVAGIHRWIKNRQWENRPECANPKFEGRGW